MLLTLKFYCVSFTPERLNMSEEVNDEVPQEVSQEPGEEKMEVPEIGDIGLRLKQIEEEAQKIRDMQNNVERFDPSTGSSNPQLNLSIEEKQAKDIRSVFVGNVDYSATPEQLEEHFRGCGAIERVTILADKFSGNPKGFAYIEFTEVEGKQHAMALNESLFLGRQIKVTEKRTNKPGISTTNRPPRGRGRVRTVVRYVYPGFRGARGRAPRRGRGFQPY
ncbi:unnamed protein product [Bursaphelenchus xylophilus]|uniref:(pine wood nematode) hypothetical protein n=1 Tax=Bursaphelenchus xylophilus TaxID=6326 RepID=A0A1I7S931_BURXY|nr:unnamed protein product [Bursaphelenchus xylophilus]CAG9086197.1 unnamed protein product [Bursaphelenchus xylophilus]